MLLNVVFFSKVYGIEENREAKKHGVSLGQTSKKIKVIVDDDFGMEKDLAAKFGSYVSPWVPVTDPDGGIELLYLLQNPNIEIVGITTCFGVGNIDIAMGSVKQILERTGNTHIPYFAGVESKEGVGKANDVTDFIIKTVMENPGEIEILATAPPSNIATAMMLEPELKDNWKMLHFGSADFLGVLGMKSNVVLSYKMGYQDVNTISDEVSFRHVFYKGGDNMIIYPNEIMDDSKIIPSQRKELRASGKNFAKWVHREIDTWSKVLTLLFGGMTLHGTIPAALIAQHGIKLIAWCEHIYKTISG
jgi:inosine-uridine nucleoside N-ribohydrolase